MADPLTTCCTICHLLRIHDQPDCFGMRIREHQLFRNGLVFVAVQFASCISDLMTVNTALHDVARIVQPIGVLVLQCRQFFGRTTSSGFPRFPAREALLLG